MGNDRTTFGDILANCLLVAEPIEGIDEVTFSEDVRTRYAVLHPLVIIGEASKRLFSEARSMMPEIPWGSIA